jgi:hypothetical protein
MNDLDDRTAANLNVVLEDACRVLPHGVDHSFRKKIARKLLGLRVMARPRWRALTLSPAPLRPRQ